MVKLKQSITTCNDDFFCLYKDSAVGLDKLVDLEKTRKETHVIELKADEDVDTDDELLVRGVSHCVKDLLKIKELLLKDTAI